MVLIISIYLVIGPIIDNPQIEYLYALSFIFTGLIFYIPFVKLGMTPRFMSKYHQRLGSGAPNQLKLWSNWIPFQIAWHCSCNFYWKLFQRPPWACSIRREEKKTRIKQDTLCRYLLNSVMKLIEIRFSIEMHQSERAQSGKCSSFFSYTKHTCTLHRQSDLCHSNRTTTM